MTEQGMRIKRARMAIKMSQRSLAEATEMSQSVISAYERGIKVPSLTVAAKIANTLGVTLDWLATGDGVACLIKTKGDIVKMIYDLSIKTYATIDCGETENEFRVCIMDEDIAEFVKKRSRMIENLADNFIDVEVFELWERKQIHTLSNIPIE